MPTFIISTSVEKVSKTYGSKDIICRIYQIKKLNEQPWYIGFVRYNTASTCGAVSEAFRKLIELKIIPKKYYNYSKCDWRSAGYYCPEVEEAGYRIYEVY